MRSARCAPDKSKVPRLPAQHPDRAAVDVRGERVERALQAVGVIDEGEQPAAGEGAKVRGRRRVHRHLCG